MNTDYKTKAAATNRRAGKKAMNPAKRSMRNPKKTSLLSNFITNRFVEIVIVGLIFFFSMLATHMLWLLIGHPDSPLLDKGFEMFSSAVTTLIGALVMKLTPNNKK